MADGRNLKTVNSEAKRYRKTLGSYDASAFSFNSYDRWTPPTTLQPASSMPEEPVLYRRGARPLAIASSQRTSCFE